MHGDLQLCPCCAAHLRVPAALHVMRCKNCDAELTLIDSGGVRGLALLPPIGGDVPYSTPEQRAGRNRLPFDGSELLFHRRRLLHTRASRRHAAWSSVFLLSVCAFALTCVVGIGGGRDLLGEHGGRHELSALALLGAMMALPVLGYFALYLQGRARLALEDARKWSD